MFEHLAEFPRILVTGPQRSGTRIATTMIAADTGYWPVFEEDFGVDSLNRLWRILETGRSIVIQAPAMAVHAGDLLERDQDLAVVFMWRGRRSIIGSQKRIGWRWELPELMRYHRLEGVISDAKYSRWYASDRWHGIDSLEGRVRSFDERFVDLRNHPLWVPKRRRLRFHARQTQ